MNEASKEFMEAETIQGMPKSEYDRHMEETANVTPEDFIPVEEAIKTMPHVMVEDAVMKFLPVGRTKIKIRDGKYVSIYDVRKMVNGTTEIIIEL